MGVVYKAEHRETRTQAALKTVRVPRHEMLRGLRREIRALAQLRHPGIVRIVDHGVEGGLPWYAMELLEGKALLEFGASQSVARAGSGAWGQVSGTRDGWAGALEAETRGPVEVELDRPEAGPETGRGTLPRQSQGPAPAGSLIELLSVMRRLCMALAYLHGEGIVHRDLKPENILLPEPQLPVIVDFGLVSRFGGEESRESLEEGSGASGTLAYMAPEQIRGELCDARTDLYALGCILYRMLAGRPPFDGGSAEEVQQGHLNVEPPPPSAWSRELPQGLDRLVLRLLAKRPEDRIGHADTVAAALAELGAEGGFPGTTPAARAYLYRPSFTGRGPQMKLLKRKLWKLDAGQGGLVLMGGESGAGKTRLVLELGRVASQRGIEVLLGQCQPAGPGRAEGAGRPLQPLLGPLQAVADLCRERGPAETGRILGTRGHMLGLYEPSLLGLPGLKPGPEEAPGDPRAARQRLFDTLAETFASLARDRPVLLAIDDLQWADELSLGFLEYLLRVQTLGVEAQHFAPFLVVGTYRTEEIGKAGREGLRRWIEEAGVDRILLGRLELEAVGSMVRDMLALGEMPERFVEYLTRCSEGNPFFVAEYLRTAVSEGVLYRDESGHWLVSEPEPEAAGGYEGLPLPGSLRALVLRRLEALGGAARKLAELAAVLGRESDEGLLAELGARRGIAELDSVEELLSRQVLEPAGPGALRFAHDKIREVAYEGIDPQELPAIHRAAAETLEALGEGHKSERQAALGQHWEAAGEGRKARPYYLAAARRAAGRYAHKEAEELYGAYLGLAEGPTPEGVEARNELAGKLLLLQGRCPEAIAAHSKAVEEARQIGNRALEAVSLLGLGRAHWSAGQTEEARRLYLEGLEVSVAAGERQTEGTALGALGLLSQEQGRIEAARGLHERALRLYQAIGDRSGEAGTLGNLAIACHDQGQLEEAHALYEQALRLHRDLGDRRREGIAQGNLGNLHNDEGRLPEAQEHFEQALRIHREVGNRRHEGIVLGNLALVHYQQGQIELAREMFEQALRIHREVGNRRHEGNVLGNLAALERQDAGGLEKAAELTSQAEAVLGVVGDPVELGKILCQRGHIALAQGQDARPQLEQAKALVQASGARPESDLGARVAQLQAAQTAFEAGATQRLLGGELAEELPEGLRRSLQERAARGSGDV